MKKNLLFLHGFMGHRRNFSTIAGMLGKNFNCLMPDLPGHGDNSISSAPDFITTAEKIHHMVRENAAPTYLAAYSMGGRLGLYLLTHHPGLFKAALIESAHPGPENENEKRMRKESDAVLLQGVRDPELLRLFLEKWYQQPMFGALRRHPQFPQYLEEKLQGDVKQWQLALDGLGTALQPNLWPEIKKITCPMIYLSGALDQKYVEVGSRLKKLNPSIKVVSSYECGHNVHLENPGLFCELIRELTGNSTPSSSSS